MLYLCALPWSSGDGVEEVAWLLAELKLASRCAQITYSRSAFSTLIWEVICRRLGWAECIENNLRVKKAVCDGDCCKVGDEGKFSLEAQHCKGAKSLPFPCLTINVCTLLGT